MYIFKEKVYVDYIQEPAKNNIGGEQRPEDAKITYIKTQHIIKDGDICTAYISSSFKDLCTYLFLYANKYFIQVLKVDEEQYDRLKIH